MGWVEDRAICTLEIAFDNIRDFVKRDVDEANSLLPEKRGNEPLRVLPGDGGIIKRFYVTGFSLNTPEGDERTIIFELHNDEIFIDRSRRPETLPDLPNLIVKQKWDFSTSKCLLCIDGEIKSAQEISQIALEPLFFG